MEASKKRIIYIDLIKVFLTCMVVAHHAGQAYGTTGGVWLVSDMPKLSYLKPFFFMNAAYLMGFYFFISGFFTFYALKSKTTKKFVQDRLVRLGLPLIFFAIFVFGPLHYFLNKSDANYFKFIADLHFNHPPLSFGHLWFVASLLVYSVFYLIIAKGLTVRIQFSRVFKFWYPLIYLAFLIPVNVMIRQTYPIDAWVTWLIPIEPAHLPQYLSMFLLGALFNKTGWIETVKPLTAFSYTFLGLLLFTFKDFIYQQFPDLWAESTIESFLCVGLCLGIIPFFKTQFNSMNRMMKFLSDNSFGIYLFHLFIVLGLQSLLTYVKLNTNMKFIFVTMLAIFLSGILTAFLRKNNFIKKIL